MAKPAIVTWVEENYEQIECGFYQTMGVTAYSAAIGSLFTGQFWAAGGATLIGGAAEYAWNLNGCGGNPPPKPAPPDKSCQAVDGGAQLWRYIPDNEQDQRIDAGMAAAVKIVGTDYSPGDPDQGLSGLTAVYWEDVNGTLQNSRDGLPAGYSEPFYYLIPNEGSSCISDPSDHTPGDPIADPITHDDGTCEWTIQAYDSYVDASGTFHVYYVISANNDACGGPFAYWSTSEGPDFVNPDTPRPDPDPDPDGPNPTPPPHDWQPDYTKPIEEIQDDIDDIKDRLDEIKECACNEPEPCPPTLRGDWISTHWVSDSPSAGGTKPLRKLFRYLSESTRDKD